MIRGHAQMDGRMWRLILEVLADEHIHGDVPGGGEHLGHPALMRRSTGVHVQSAEEHAVLTHRFQRVGHPRQREVVSVPTGMPQLRRTAVGNEHE